MPDLPNQDSDSKAPHITPKAGAGEDSGWDRMWEAFHEIVEVGEAGRATLLQRLDPDLRHQVESLLEAHEQATDEFPQSPINSTAYRDPLVGQSVGPYRVRQLLGEGGMGMVYVAEQEAPIRRLVALKVIKLGMDTREILARFESERQALVMMNHPNIASALDAGVTDDGRPYFVMEYVAGLPIDHYCDKNRLTLHERLELFVRVCRGVHHAHLKGIIHRDLKPSNVLVAVIDGEPIPKVIDFGIAKAIRQRLTEKTLYTQVGMLIGTPEYMSPEQADLGRMEADPRSDVYSLGVILYRLLVGALPFESKTLREAGHGEVRRMLSEVEPPSPSGRLRELAGEAERVARERRTTRERLARELEEELDWVAAQAMEKDPTRRYASAADLAGDVERYLAGEAVKAGPINPAYRLKRLARRYRGRLQLAAAAVVALLVLSVGFSAISPRLSPRPSPAVNTELLQSASEEVLEAAYAKSGEGLRVAVTLGSLPHSSDDLDLDRLRTMTTQLEKALTDRQVPTIGFVNEKKLYVDGEVDERIDILKQWLDAGVELGNQTFAHTSLCEVSGSVFQEDVIRGETVIRQLMSERGRNLSYFRYPFLCTGLDLETKRSVEGFLDSHRYVVAPVTLENSDYLYSKAYRHFIDSGDEAQAAEVGEAYLDYSEKIFAFHEKSSQAVLGRQVRHILLIEATLLNGVYLERLLTLMAERGYEFIRLEEALNDPAYDLPDNRFSDMGESWIWRWQEYAKNKFNWNAEEPIPGEPIWRAAKVF